MNHFAFRFIIEATINAELVLIKIAENNLPVVDLNEEALFICSVIILT